MRDPPHLGWASAVYLATLSLRGRGASSFTQLKLALVATTKAAELGTVREVLPSWRISLMARSLSPNTLDGRLERARQEMADEVHAAALRCDDVRPDDLTRRREARRRAGEGSRDRKPLRKPAMTRDRYPSILSKNEGPLGATRIPEVRGCRPDR